MTDKLILGVVWVVAVYSSLRLLVGICGWLYTKTKLGGLTWQVDKLIAHLDGKEITMPILRWVILTVFCWWFILS